MSAALVERVAESPKTAVEFPKRVPVATPVPAEPVGRGDVYPLVPVFLIGGLALIGALAFVGFIVMWLMLRHSGVMAP